MRLMVPVYAWLTLGLLFAGALVATGICFSRPGARSQRAADLTGTIYGNSPGLSPRVKAVAAPHTREQIYACGGCARQVHEVSRCGSMMCPPEGTAELSTLETVAKPCLTGITAEAYALAYA